MKKIHAILLLTLSLLISSCSNEISKVQQSFSTTDFHSSTSINSLFDTTFVSENFSDDSLESVSSSFESSNEVTFETSTSFESSNDFSYDSSIEETDSKIRYLVPKGTINDNLEITYFQLENSNSSTQCGDATYIKIGDIDIVIDAGEKRIGSEIVAPYLKNHVTDKKIELVITTHTDSDHIGGMVGLSNQESPLTLNGFSYDTIIDCGFDPGTIVVSDYYNIVNERVKEGAFHYTYYDMILNDEIPSSFYLGKDASLDLLDTKFYTNYMNLTKEEMKKKATNSTYKNNCSVPFLLTHGKNTFLFAGDCETTTEKALVDYNDLPQIDVFKANHHGSDTSNTTYLLDVIKPKNVIIESTSENRYGIPSKNVLDRFKTYTLNVFAPFINGNIHVLSDMIKLNFSCDGFFDYSKMGIEPGSETIISIFDTEYYSSKV